MYVCTKWYASHGIESIFPVCLHPTEPHTQVSIATCSVPNPHLNTTFVPPFAEVNSTPYSAMYASEESSYANFRFYSEPMLAGNSIVPPDVQKGWLALHNKVGCMECTTHPTNITTIMCTNLSPFLPSLVISCSLFML